MTTTEKLPAIKARCEALLETASKRTPGEWIHKEGRRMCLRSSSVHSDPVLYGDEYELAGVDGDFIASCAGPAEAGWRATIAAIDGALEVRGCFDAAITEGLNERIGENDRHPGTLNDLVTRRLLFAYDAAEKQIREIITAWEGLI